MPDEDCTMRRFCKLNPLSRLRPSFPLFFFLFFWSILGPAAVYGSSLRMIITYPSSVSADGNGPLDLKAELNFDNQKLHAPIVVVMHGYSPITNFPDVRTQAQRLCNAGFFAISVALRGRDGSDGIRDSGGVEIYDIYDAVEYIKHDPMFGQLVDPNNVHITGYSGGGGNVMSALTKFPDYFRLGSGFFGMSDYGYDQVYGWYFLGGRCVSSGADGN